MGENVIIQIKNAHYEELRQAGIANPDVYMAEIYNLVVGIQNNQEMNEVIRNAARTIVEINRLTGLNGNFNPMEREGDIFWLRLLSSYLLGTIPVIQAKYPVGVVINGEIITEEKQSEIINNAYELLLPVIDDFYKLSAFAYDQFINPQAPRNENELDIIAQRSMENIVKYQDLLR